MHYSPNFLFQFVHCALAGLAERNPIPREYAEHIDKFLPVMRSYNEMAAAQYLEDWIHGNLELAPLLDVSANLGGHV